MSSCFSKSCIHSNRSSSSSSNFKNSIYDTNELFLGIRHYTNINNCIQILQKEKLYAPIENDRVLEIELKLLVSGLLS